MNKLSTMDKVFLGLTRQGNIPYTPMFSFRIRENIDFEILKSVCKDIWNLYPFLHSYIKYKKKDAELEEKEFDISKFLFYKEESSFSVEEFFTNFSNSYFNPISDPLIYFYLIKTSDSNYLIIRWHHSLFDGISALKLIEIILIAYLNKKNNQNIDIPKLERITISELISRYSKFRNGQKIPSKFLFNLKAISNLLSILKMKLFKTTEGPFNKGEFDRGKVIYSSLKLDKNITEKFNELKNEYGITENDILIAIIFKSYFKWLSEESKYQARLTLPMDIRPKKKNNLLGNLMIPIYVFLKEKDLKSKPFLLKKIKIQMNKNKDSNGPIFAQVYLDNRGISLKKINKHTKISFKVANIQLSNMGTINHRFNEVITNNFKIIESESLILPKPKLTSVLTTIKTNNIINIGITYIHEIISSDRIKSFFNILRKTIQDITK